MVATGTAVIRRARVVDLYKRCIQEIPRIITIFDLDHTEKQLRHDVRRLFNKNQGVTDPRVIDRLIWEGESHLEETVHVWKQKTHLLRLLGYDKEVEPVLKQYQDESPFLKNFYENKC
mmetsp:Transcript_17802/g.28819  ORF Transcript_17802/g.28819 Transcript_17802/m.28819 type:complete len:118 (+) Transcript_17802:82-435(+)